MMVEEVIAGGTPHLGCPCEQSERQPARVTVRDNSLGSPNVGGHCPLPGLPILMSQITSVVRWGASVGSLTDFGGVGRRGQSWGHSTTGVST